MKILFSILVHENLEIIHDQIINFKKYNPNCLILLHVSKKFKESNIEEINLLPSQYRNVYINSKSIITGLMDNSQLNGHLLNIEYSIVNNIKYDYLSLHASNDMFVKKGLIEYMCNYDAGSSNNKVLPNTTWKQGINSLKDSKLKSILKQHNTKEIFGSQVEGLFIKKEIVIKIYESILKYNKKSTIEKIDSYLREIIPSKYYLPIMLGVFPGYLYGKEEVYFASFIPIFTSNIGLPYVFINWNNNLIVEKNDIKAIINNDFTYLSQKLNVDSKYVNNFFAVKRVDRDMENPIRKFINNL